MSTKLNILKRHLKSGQVYRRAELAVWSNSVDRHLQKLQEEGFLVKVSTGLYLRPKKSTFGILPASYDQLVRSFLKDDNFLLISFNDFNALGVGTTQLYNEIIVYNHKRHGRFKLGNRTFNFMVKHYFPKTLTPEFLLVDLVNNIELIAEDQNKLLERVKKRASDMNKRTLVKCAQKYGAIRTKKFFMSILKKHTLPNPKTIEAIDDIEQRRNLTTYDTVDTLFEKLTTDAKNRTKD